VEEIISSGGDCVGLEAGSKPELMAVLALSQLNGVIVCNGYKDREYIRMALIGLQLGHRVYIVIEKLSELELVIREAHDMGVRPLLGMRMRLTSIGAGKWQNTGGKKSKFGLSSQQVLSMVQWLESEDMTDCLQLLHFHMGSQIPNIQDIQHGMREAARYYTELVHMGIPIQCVDVGGGLGVDYEGTRSRSFCSMNYSVQEYARNIVQTLAESCNENEVPCPDIFSESGRALTAHHAALITNVIDIEQVPNGPLQQIPDDDDPAILNDLWDGLENLDQRSALESYHDAVSWLEEAQGMYVHGVLDLQQRACAEQLYFETCRRVRPLLQPGNRAHREVLDELNETLADKYFCNFSLFQSMPDVWAIQQIFPIVPLHRLNEEPTRRAIVQDITCDSDGRIDQYVDMEGVETTLPVHALETDAPYLLGVFMVGAYQEILGDMHNLFGDTDSVNVELLPDGSFQLSQVEQGDTVDDVLEYVHISADDLLQTYQQKVADSGLSENIQSTYLEELEAGLRGYTYLED
ncbi:MAG: biosynthetic arginine decarboxylase, partial [Gammaproteobacteria bacterium]|nr:biosynthetic arginine decarboxylase [Gammaproteobacteria bacterium]